MIQLEPDDNTKWLGWRLGSEATKQTEELTGIKNEIGTLNKVLIELSLKLSQLINKDIE